MDHTCTYYCSPPHHAVCLLGEATFTSQQMMEHVERSDPRAQGKVVSAKRAYEAPIAESAQLLGLQRWLIILDVPHLNPL